MKNKHCWKGIFNYSRELLVLFCYAFSEKQAKEVFFRRLAKKHGVSVYAVRQIFDGSKDNMSIKIETEFHEVADEEQTFHDPPGAVAG